ncbi:MAG: FAD-dependent oxidoreductase [Acidobacteria bacterium]|nr:FAD-dependent oxidoreductase [Acidobacteriota bacterium]
MSGRARVLLVGGGHSHLEILRRHILKPHPGISLTLVSAASKHHYSGMVPGFLAGTYREAEIAFDLAALSASAGSRFLEGQAVSVDPTRRVVRMADGEEVGYDLVSFGVGSSTRGSSLPGVQEHAWTVKPIGRAVALRAALMELASRSGGEAARAVVVGSGAAGIEVACAAAAVFHRTGRSRELTIVGDGKEILEGYSPRMRRRAVRVLEAKQCSILLGARVAEVRPDSVRLSDGREIPSDLTVWLTGPAAYGLFEGSGLALDKRGYLLVDDALRSVSDGRVFGAGDCATLSSHPHTPKAGVYAVREGPVLWKSLVATVEETSLPRYVPQGDFLSILNTADGRALLRYRGIVSGSRWAWRLKDRIDRHFMRKYQTLEPEALLSPGSKRTSTAR